MSKYINNKIESLVDAGASFASAITTKEVKLDNYQSAKVVISTGAGDESTTIAKVITILPDATEKEIKSQEITIGNNTESKIDIVADELAHDDANSFKITIDAVADSTITGSVVVVLGDARYSEE